MFVLLSPRSAFAGRSWFRSRGSAGAERQASRQQRRVDIARIAIAAAMLPMLAPPTV
jgi:hypothetical protein